MLQLHRRRLRSPSCRRSPCSNPKLAVRSRCCHRCPRRTLTLHPHEPQHPPHSCAAKRGRHQPQTHQREPRPGRVKHHLHPASHRLRMPAHPPRTPARTPAPQPPQASHRERSAASARPQDRVHHRCACPWSAPSRGEHEPISRQSRPRITRIVLRATSLLGLVADEPELVGRVGRRVSPTARRIRLAQYSTRCTKGRVEARARGDAGAVRIDGRHPRDDSQNARRCRSC